jgi:hypothetical protein
MTAEQKAAFVMAQAACAHAEIAGMQAENQANLANGMSVIYGEPAFASVIEKYGLHVNALTTFFGS